MSWNVFPEMDVASDVPNAVSPNRHADAVASTILCNTADLSGRQLGIIPEHDVVNVVRRAARLDDVKVDVLR